MKTKQWTIICLLVAGVAITSCKNTSENNKMPVTTNSEMAEAYYNQATGAVKAFRLDFARALLTEATRLDPDFFMAYSYHTMMNFGTPKFNDYARKAVNCKGKLNQGEMLLKSCLEKILENPAADVTREAKQMITMYPKDEDLHFFLVTFQYISGDAKGRLETIKKGIEITKNPGPWYNLLGYAHLDLGNLREASAAFDKYIETEPENPNAYDSKGDYFMKITDYEHAYEFYMRANSLDTLWSFKKAMTAKHLNDSIASLMKI